MPSAQMCRNATPYKWNQTVCAHLNMAYFVLRNVLESHLSISD